jgi:hypothetical protein
MLLNCAHAISRRDNRPRLLESAAASITVGRETRVMPNNPFVDIAALPSLSPVRYLDAGDRTCLMRAIGRVPCVCRSRNGM